MIKAGKRVLEGLAEAVRHAQGEDVPGLVVHVPAAVDVAAVRRRMGFTQAAFASRIGVSLGAPRTAA